jgi:hypothetical protein
MNASMRPAADSPAPSPGRQQRGAVLRSALLSPEQRTEQARRAAFTRWNRSKENEDAGRLRSRLGKLRATRENLLAAIVGNATAGAAGRAVLGKEEVGAVRAALAELRMELPAMEARLERLAPLPDRPKVSRGPDPFPAVAGENRIELFTGPIAPD